MKAPPALRLQLVYDKMVIEFLSSYLAVYLTLFVDLANIFAKILRNEIPSEKVYENDHVYAFNDINPQAKIHVLIIPKANYCSFSDFTENASPTEQANFYKSIKEIAKKLELKDGFRLTTNIGKNGGQEVPHFHFHLLCGKNIL